MLHCMILESYKRKFGDERISAEFILTFAVRVYRRSRWYTLDPHFGV